jgi:uncharacterized protein YacL
MLKKIMKFVFGLFGAIIGYETIHIFGIANVIDFSWENLDLIFTSRQFFGIIIGGLIGFFLISFLLEKFLKIIIGFEYNFKKISWKKSVMGILGIIIGIGIGVLINYAFSISTIPRIGHPIQILINLISAYLGFSLAIYKNEEISKIIFRNNKSILKNGKFDEVISNKILDTSVIIDGRIADICSTGFIEGILIVPEFVLEELRHIADSSDVLKRNRGRRGLDILKQMQKNPDINIEIINQDFDDILEVDSKLVKLAQLMDAIIVTNDYNLNKVADLQGVFVLNINELANAVKPVVLPGEAMYVKVIKEGKENGQGIGYLDDGTMIVVDEGIKYMGERVSVLVTSILQTAAGRMIFAKPKAHEQIM